MRVARRRAITAVVPGAIVVVGVTMLVRTILRHRTEVTEQLATASWGWIVLGALGALAAVAGLAERWRATVRTLGSEVALGTAVRWFTAGQLGKYAPGGVWQVVGQGELAARGGVPRRAAYASVVLTTIALVGGAAVVVTASRPTPFAAAAPAWAAVTGLAIAVVIIEPHLRRRVLRLVRIDHELATGRALQLVIGTVPTWLCIGTATWCVTRALVDDAPFGAIVVAAVASWLVGIVALPVPGGLGVREAVYAASLHTLAPSVDPGTAAFVALVARLVFVAADLVWLPLGRLAGRSIVSDGPPRGPSSTAAA